MTIVLLILISSTQTFTMSDDQKKLIEAELTNIIIFTRNTPPLHQLNANLARFPQYREIKENLTWHEFSQGIEFIKSNLQAKHNTTKANEQYKLQQQLEFLTADRARK